MTRQARIYFQKAVYHVTIRGNNRQNILEDDKDKAVFLDCLKKFKVRFGFKLYAFVIMDNHVHLIIEANSAVNISKIMQAITLSYSVKFRKKYSYSGYVWQGRFKSNVIDGDRYIVECINYIHHNPIRANMVSDPEDYSWSSWNFYNADHDTSGNNFITGIIDKFADQ